MQPNQVVKTMAQLLTASEVKRASFGRPAFTRPRTRVAKAREYGWKMIAREAVWRCCAMLSAMRWRAAISHSRSVVGAILRGGISGVALVVLGEVDEAVVVMVVSDGDSLSLRGGREPVLLVMMAGMRQSGVLAAEMEGVMALAER